MQNPQTKHYHIVRAMTVESLIREVDRLYVLGWTPFGSPFLLPEDDLLEIGQAIVHLGSDGTPV